MAGFLAPNDILRNLNSRRRLLRGHFLVHGHVLSTRRVTLLNPGLYGELHPKLDIGPYSLMASDVFLSLQNEYSPKSQKHDNG